MRFSGGWCLASDIVQVIFAIYAEFRMFEFPSLRDKHRVSGDAHDRPGIQDMCAYLWAVRGCSVFLILANFVKVILVKLADETGKVAVFKMFGKNCFGKLLVLSLESVSRRRTDGDIGSR